MKKLCFDLDGTLCTNTNGLYHEAKPIKKAIDKVNLLYKEGFKIIIFTARFMGKNKENSVKAYEEGFNFTKLQIDEWGLLYHDLIMGKPTFDLVVDDKNLNFKDNWIEFDFHSISKK